MKEREFSLMALSSTLSNDNKQPLWLLPLETRVFLTPRLVGKVPGERRGIPPSLFSN